MRLDLMLADFAQVYDGKLTVVGAGWNLVGPVPSPSAIGMMVEVPWDMTNHEYQFRVQLETEDGSLDVGEPGTDLKAVVNGTIEAGRPAGHPKGAPILAPIALVIGPLALRPDTRYRWRVFFDDETHEDWTLSFRTRPNP